MPLHQDPPTPQQEAELWDKIVRSINAGWGLVANWVSPPGNRPIGIRGSQSFAYGGGTIFHYVAIMGYADDEPQAVWVADPGFRPHGAWISRRNNATLIPPKAYAWPAIAGAAAIPTPPAVSAPPAAAIDTLIAAMAPTTVSRTRFEQLLPATSEALVRCQCNTVNRIAMWCAQIGHESGGLRYMEELASGSAYEGRADLGNTQPGDGVRFKGRGPIQVTGRHNYTQLSQWAFGQGYVPSATFFVDAPHELASDRWGMLGVQWYWLVARPGINAQADARDIEGVTRAINGGTHGLQDRTERWNRCLAMGDRLLELTAAAPAPPLPAPPEEGFLMALTAEEQRELLDLLRSMASDRTASISPFRHLGSEQAGAVTMSRRVDFLDGNVHVIMSMLLASIGDPGHLALLAEVASADGDSRYPDRQTDARLAKVVLAWAESHGFDVPELPVIPAWTCLMTGTANCRDGTAGECGITRNGICIKEFMT